MHAGTRRIRLVTLDALHTILTPRLPIHIQYAQVFRPYLRNLDPDDVKRSFKLALKELQTDKPAYQSVDGVSGWWSEVIKKTAIGAGAVAADVNAALPNIVPQLMTRFSTKEGYKLFDDVLPVLERLSAMNVRTALVSNADSRVRAVLQDLGVAAPGLLTAMVLSEEEEIEKPDAEMFHRALTRVNYASGLAHGSILPSQCLHVGDELRGDYFGALDAGMHAVLIRRPGAEGAGEHKDDNEDLHDVKTVGGLSEVMAWL